MPGQRLQLDTDRDWFNGAREAGGDKANEDWSSKSQ